MSPRSQGPVDALDDRGGGQALRKGVEAWLAGLREDLVSKTYWPDPVRRVTIPKPGGGQRPLGIPTIRDRVVQTAVKIVLEPIFEADFEDNAYGYRPRRSAVDAVKETHRLIRRGFTDVVDADLSKYFDSIPHSDLLKSVARRIVDRHVLRPIRSPLDPRMQILEIALELRFVGLPGQSIHARRGLLLELMKCLAEQIDADVVQERGELLLLPLPCGLPYAIQRL